MKVFQCTLKLAQASRFNLVYRNWKMTWFVISIALISLSANSQCIEGDCQTGFAKFKYGNGSMYFGFWKYSKPNGPGLFIDEFGDETAGFFIDGTPTISGKKNGNDFQIGYFENGVFTEGVIARIGPDKITYLKVKDGQTSSIPRPKDELPTCIVGDCYEGRGFSFYSVSSYAIESVSGGLWHNGKRYREEITINKGKFTISEFGNDKMPVLALTLGENIIISATPDEVMFEEGKTTNYEFVDPNPVTSNKPTASTINNNVQTQVTTKPKKTGRFFQVFSQVLSGATQVLALYNEVRQTQAGSTSVKTPSQISSNTTTVVYASGPVLGPYETLIETKKGVSISYEWTLQAKAKNNDGETVYHWVLTGYVRNHSGTDKQMGLVRLTAFSSTAALLPQGWTNPYGNVFDLMQGGTLNNGEVISKTHSTFTLSPNPPGRPTSILTVQN